MPHELAQQGRYTCAIAVMAKASIPGSAKTRLVPPLTIDEAAALNTAFLQDAADNLLAAARLANVVGYMAFAPAGSIEFFRRIMPSGIRLIETVAPDLGQCLFNAASSLLAAGHGAVCLINSDSPTLPVDYLVRAAAALREPGERIVIGPSTDGGYYLIGIKQAHRRLFEDIDWSTDRVFRQTLERAAELDLKPVVLPPWYDVDDADALRILVGELIEGRRFRSEDPTLDTAAASAVATRRQLAGLLNATDLSLRLNLESRRIRGA
jgi:rSAM/selenodomain-associated transferase 1